MTSGDNITWTGLFTPTADIESTSNVLTLGTGYEDALGNTGVGAQSGILCNRYRNPNY